MLWPVCLCGDFWGDAGNDRFREGGIRMEISDDGCDINRGFISFPTIVIRDEAQGREGNFSFAAESGLGGVGHADEVETHRTVHVRFGAGGESWAVHGNVGSSIVKSSGVIRGRFDEKFTH